ncbi:mCG147550 [Mus musculus]|jgi:hypothetical protein|nr:mCG147550 [Mus musculus]
MEWAQHSGETRNELRAALCPSKQKSRQKSEEESRVSETICVMLWKPGSLIKAPTGPGIRLSFPDFIPWLDTEERAAGLRFKA